MAFTTANDWRASRAALAAVLFALSSPSRALAADAPASRTSSLSWVRLPGAEPCVSAQDLARDVEQRLGHAVFVSPSQADVSVEGHIEPAGGARSGGGGGSGGGAGWHAVVVLRDAHGAPLGTRELARPDASCDAMRAPLALVIAVMIDPEASLSPKAPAPPAASQPAPPPPAPVVIETPVPVLVRAPEAAVPPKTWHLDGGGAVIGGLGLLPNASIGLFGQMILEPPIFFGLEGYAALWLDQGPTPTFSLAYLGGGLCPLHAHSPLLDVYGCGSGQLGYLKTSNPALSPSDQVHLALAGEVRGTIHVAGPFTLRSGLTLIVPLLRDTFTQPEASGAAGGQGAKVFQMSAVAATLDLGVGVAFP